MTTKQKIDVRKVVAITLSWVGISLIVTVYDHFVYNSYFSVGPSDLYTFTNNIYYNVSAAFVAGLLAGSLQVFVINVWFRNKPYIYTLFFLALCFIIVLGIIMLLTGLLFIKITYGISVFSHFDAAKLELGYYIKNPLLYKNIIAWSVILLSTQFVLQMNDKFGPGLLWSFATGKYNVPQTEERIFMFLDIKDSTKAAERMGNTKYYQFLKNFYSDITDPILNNYGQIYQYIGDEVVISWKMKKGLRKNHCFETFFAIQKIIKNKGHKYMSKFGFIPEFKAGVHYGQVTAGEIGVIKRDITYSGDVLNTTARIQTMCNELNCKLLVSKKLIDLSTLGNTSYLVEVVGAVELKGKADSEFLVSLKKTGTP